MRDRILLLGYLAAVVAGTLVHDPRVLAAAAVVVVATAATGAPEILRRAVLAALPFALAVSLGWLLLVRDDPAAAVRALTVINLRVLLLTLLAFRVLPRLDLQRVFAFSPTLRFVLILATSQVLTFRRLFMDFRHALTVRTPRRIGPVTAIRHGAATGAWFLRRAEHDATDITQALDARGFFLDQD